MTWIDREQQEPTEDNEYILAWIEHDESDRNPITELIVEVNKENGCEEKESYCLMRLAFDELTKEWWDPNEGGVYKFRYWMPAPESPYAKLALPQEEQRY